MKNKTIIFTTSLVILIPLFAGLILWNKLPAELAIHFDTNGNADNWCHKGWAIFGIPLFVLAAQFFCLFMTAHDPNKKNISDKIFSLVIWICPICSVICGIVIYANSLDISFSVFAIIQSFLGIGIMIIGNYLPKSKQNYSIGIKLPWTLSDNENWNSTHRFAGKVWFAGGFIMVVNSFINSWLISLAVILLLAGLPIIYSWIYHTKHRNTN